MSSIWVKCSFCGCKFDIEDSIRAEYECPKCGYKCFEYDDNIDKFDDYYLRRNDEDYEGIKY